MDFLRIDKFNGCVHFNLLTAYKCFSHTLCKTQLFLYVLKNA